MTRRRFFGVLLLGLVLTAIITPQITHAKLVVDCTAQAVDPISKKTYTECSIADFLRQFVVISQYGLGVVGVLAVGMLVYSGFEFITAAGRKDKIEHGKQILLGTVIGIAISLTAFIIINTAVTAVSGTTTKNSSNPFSGLVGTVFGGRKITTGNTTVNINRPFSGIDLSDPRATCNNANDTKYSKTCDQSTPQIFCADLDADSGTIHGWQSLLNGHNCNCGKVDGCFGKNTVNCVRAFQVVNRISPTGYLDEATKNLLTLPGPVTAKDCDGSFSDPIIAQFPSVASEPVAGLSATDTGCCAVGSSDGAVAYYADNVTEQTCGAISRLEERFDKGKYCATGKFRNAAGFCEDSQSRCMQYVSQGWCQNIAKDATTPSTQMSFTPGTCKGMSFSCLAGCKETVLLSPEN